MAMTIEDLIQKERWTDTRVAIRSALKKKPQSHWLLTRMSMTYHEQRRYKEALKWAERAFDIAPDCPLVLWDYAGTLQALGRHTEALDLYGRIVTRDISDLATGECGEGRAWAKGLVADSHYRASISLRAIGNRKASLSALKQCLDLRGPGCRSIYPLDSVAAKAERIQMRSAKVHGAPSPESRARTAKSDKRTANSGATDVSRRYTDARP